MPASNAINNAVTNASTNANRELVVSRVFDAPNELVWEAWTNPQHVGRWWGPHGFTTTIQEMDVRPGGVWKHVMHGPDGTNYPNKSVFIEVVKPERIVFSHGGSKKGGPAVKFHSTWTFVALDNKTEVTVRMLFETAEERDQIVKVYGALEGGKQTLERLAEHLAGMSSRREPARDDLVLTRVFDAPRELVFQAWTDPQSLAQWWGPNGFTTPVCEADARPGGAIRIHMRGPDGTVYPMTGVYNEVVPPERIVFTSSPLDEAGNPMFEVEHTVTLAAQGSKTTLTLRARVVMQTAKAPRYLAGMEAGWTQSLERLGRYLAGS